MNKATPRPSYFPPSFLGARARRLIQVMIIACCSLLLFAGQAVAGTSKVHLIVLDDGGNAIPTANVRAISNGREVGKVQSDGKDGLLVMVTTTTVERFTLIIETRGYQGSTVLNLSSRAPDHELSIELRKLGLSPESDRLNKMLMQAAAMPGA